MTITSFISIRAKIKEIGFHSLIYGFGSVAQSAVGFVLLPILTGALSKSDYGAYSLITVIGTVASAIFYFGMTSALPRSYFDYKLEEDKRAIFTTAFLILIVGASVQVILGCAYATRFSLLLFDSKIYAEPIKWALCGGALSFINAFFFGYLRLQRRSIAAVLLSLLSLGGTIALVLLFLSHDSGGVIAPFKGIAYAQAIIAIIFLLTYGRFAFIFRFNKKEAYPLIHFGLASVIASFGQILMDWTDRLIIERYMNLGDVGLYSAAFRVGMIINVVFIYPFSQIWSPMIMEYKNRSNIRDLFKNIFSIFIILGGIGIIFFALFAQELLPLLIKSEVNQAVIQVSILTMSGYLFYGLTNIVVAGLFYERKVYQLSYVYYGAAAIKALINISIIPIIGLVGAALSTLVTCILVPVGVYSLARKYFSFEIEWRRLIIFAFIAFPYLTYGLYVSSVLEISISLRICWFFIAPLLISYFCFSSSEKTALIEFLRGKLTQ